MSVRRAVERDNIPLPAARHRRTPGLARHDYKEAWLHAKLGWLVPPACAKALAGQIGRRAALVGVLASLLPRPPIAAHINH